MDIAARRPHHRPAHPIHPIRSNPMRSDPTPPQPNPSQPSPYQPVAAQPISTQPIAAQPSPSIGSEGQRHPDPFRLLPGLVVERPTVGTHRVSRGAAEYPKRKKERKKENPPEKRYPQSLLRGRGTAETPQSTPFHPPPAMSAASSHAGAPRRCWCAAAQAGRRPWGPAAQAAPPLHAGAVMSEPQKLRMWRD
jgi:hypothetical protein